jgi:hypothetical protein
MAQINAKLQMPSYTDDFGNTYENIPFKIGNGANVEGFGYTNRPNTIICSPAQLFTPRRLRATFNTGSSHTYPVPTQDDIKTYINLLTEKGALCIDLIGEEWNLITEKAIGAATYKTTPYTDIAKSGVKEVGTYTYTSDVLASAITLGYRFESTPTSLLDAQKGCLENISKSKGICSGSGIGIKPRRFTIMALSQNDGDDDATAKVMRQVPVSAKAAAQVKACGVKAAPASYCLAYDGETIRNVHNLVEAAPAG